MSLAYTRLKDHLSHWREWEANPVVVKELRQAVRSQALVGALSTLLLGLFVVLCYVLARREAWLAVHQPLGPPVFGGFLVVLTVATLLFLPLYTGVRLAAERQESALDLIFITCLAPKRIVRGKLFSGAYLALMFFSVCAPFMAFTNQMRGVDLPTVLFILVCLYSIVCLAIQASILFACLPFPAGVKIGVGILFTAALMGVGYGLMQFFFSVLYSGVGAVLGNPASWVGFVILLGIILGGMRVLHSMSVTLIAADNRPRGYFNEVIRKGAQ